MINPFSLSKLEKKSIIKDYTQMTSLQQHEIAHFTPPTGFGYDATPGEWSDYHEYPCVTEKVSQLNIKRYPYGNVTEGDLVVLFPTNHDIPKGSEYNIRYDGRVYNSKTGFIAQEFIDETVLYYAMVFKL